MQLNNKKNIASLLAVASCALVNQTVSAKSEQDDWNIDAAIMYYGEQDRVSAIEGMLEGEKRFGDDAVLNGKIVVDSLSGASPSGAVPQDGVQTFTRPSGKSEYQVSAGDTPLDDTFQDLRVQGSTNWSQALSRLWTVNGGLYVSKEYDYLSYGLHTGVERDLFKGNTTLLLSAGYSFEHLDPLGGVPVVLSEMAIRGNFASEQAFQQAFDATRSGDSEDKNTTDVLFGISQTLNKNWLMQINYGFSSISGYQTDPYKIVSVVDSNAVAQTQLYERRPESREKHSVYTLFKGLVGEGIFDVSYRFTSDGWGINSNTLDTHYRHYFSSNFYSQLHLRYYHQTAADFYQPYLIDGQALPEFISADYRIGQMEAYTLGIKFGHILNNGHEISYRLEYYQQNPQNHGVSLLSGFNNHDLFPDVKTVIAQVSYKF